MAKMLKTTTSFLHVLNYFHSYPGHVLSVVTALRRVLWERYHDPKTRLHLLNHPAAALEIFIEAAEMLNPRSPPELANILSHCAFLLTMHWPTTDEFFLRVVPLVEKMSYYHTQDEQYKNQIRGVYRLLWLRWVRGLKRRVRLQADLRSALNTLVLTVKERL